MMSGEPLDAQVRHRCKVGSPAYIRAIPGHSVNHLDFLYTFSQKEWVKTNLARLRSDDRLSTIDSGLGNRFAELLPNFELECFCVTAQFWPNSFTRSPLYRVKGLSNNNRYRKS